MENLRSPDRGESIIAVGSTGLEGPEGPARVGPTHNRPDRLDEGDFLEAVSQAVLRELEGGSLVEDLKHAVHTTGVQPIYPFTEYVDTSPVPTPMVTAPYARPGECRWRVAGRRLARRTPFSAPLTPIPKGDGPWRMRLLR